MPHTYTWTSPSSLSLPSPPSGAVASTSGTANTVNASPRKPQQQHTGKMADGETATSSGPPPLVPNDGARPATTAPTTPAGWTATPASRRSSRMTPLPAPQMTPLIDTITARVTADAEKRYSSLQSELDALKKRDAEREQELTLARRSSSQSRRPASQSNALASRANGGQVWAEYPNFDEQLDFSNTITEVEKRRLKQEMDFYYKLQRENMVKQMHGAIRRKQLELEAKKKGSKRRRRRKRKTSENVWEYTDRNKYRDGNGDSESDSESASETDSDDDGDLGTRNRQVGYTIHGERRDLTDEQFDKLRRDRAKIDVVVVTTDTVPGFRCMEKCGNIKVSVPRSLLVVDDTDEEELKHAAEMAKMVRQEVYDKAIGAARRRRANAIVSFKFKAELSQNMDDDNVVLITATGNCCVVRRMMTDREVGLRRALEDGRKRYRREGDLSFLREYLSQQARASERRTEKRTLAEMDSKDLMATLAEITDKIQSDFKAKQNADPQKEMLEKLLGRKIRFDEDPFDSRKPSSPRVAMSPGGSNSGRGREVGSNVAQDVLLSILAGDTEGAASKMSKGRADEWETKTKEDKEDGGAAEWAAYDW